MTFAYVLLVFLALRGLGAALVEFHGRPFPTMEQNTVGIDYRDVGLYRLATGAPQARPWTGMERRHSRPILLDRTRLNIGRA